MVIWIAGMSASGKTAIGQEVYQQLKADNSNVVFIDGDILREINGNDLGHTVSDRMANASRISKLCKYLDSQGIDVVCAVLSIFPDWLAWNRNNILDYFEVYVRVPFDILLTRETKGLYRRAIAGEINNVVGVDIEFPEPIAPDLIIDNDIEITSLAVMGGKIVKAVAIRFK